jgi:hypothetical protein
MLQTPDGHGRLELLEYKRTYVRGPSGVIVMFAEAMHNG